MTLSEVGAGLEMLDRSNTYSSVYMQLSEIRENGNLEVSALSPFITIILTMRRFYHS